MKSAKPNKLELPQLHQQSQRCKSKEELMEALQSTELKSSSVKPAEAQECVELGGTQGGS